MIARCSSAEKETSVSCVQYVVGVALTTAELNNYNDYNVAESYYLVIF